MRSLGHSGICVVHDATIVDAAADIDMGCVMFYCILYLMSYIVYDMTYVLYVVCVICYMLYVCYMLYIYMLHEYVVVVVVAVVLGCRWLSLIVGCC